MDRRRVTNLTTCDVASYPRLYLAMRSIALLVVLTSVAAAQPSAQDIAAYQSLLLTPVGALPPFATSTMAGVVQNGVQLAVRYGYVSSDNGPGFNNIAATAVLPMGIGTTVSLTGGVTAPTSCNGCSAGVLLGLAGDTRLTEMAIGTGRDGSRLTFALNGELGFGNPKLPDRFNLISGAVGVPITLVSGGPSNSMHFAPFVTPGFGFGRREVDTGGGTNVSESGTRLMIGAGILLYNPASNLSFDVGVQHIAIDQGQTQVGLGLILGGF